MVFWHRSYAGFIAAIQDKLANKNTKLTEELSDSGWWHNHASNEST
jgi:hypothetical protein